MKVKVYPAVCSGAVRVPPSKSLAHRALLCAGLAEGTSRITGVSSSEDMAATCGALEALGRGLPSLVISLCRYVVVMIPLAFVLSRFLGASGVWHAFWLTEAVTAAISWGIYRRIFRGEGGGARC